MGFADYPFQSRYRDVQGHRIHYIDEGNGPVLVFLHGNPTSSYLWRNVIKPLSRHYRCIAPDLIGFGKSDKPDLDYRFLTHYRFVESFLLDLGLTDITLVLHDWGGPLGFRFAIKHPDRVARISFMETFPFTMEWGELPPLARPLFRAFRRPGPGKLLIMWQNLFVNLVLPMSVKRHLPRSVMKVYRSAFPRIQDRYPVYIWPNELPLDDRRNETWQAIHEIEQALECMPQPMLLLAFDPGAILPHRRVEWLRQKLPRLRIMECGAGLHFVQEDQPETIAANISAWLEESLTEPLPAAAVDVESDQGSRTGIRESLRLQGELYWRRMKKQNMELIAAWNDKGLAMLHFLEPGEDPEALLAESFPETSVVHRPEDDTNWLSADTPLHLVGTPFQRRVWRALIGIPAGETRSYKAIAEELASQPRAVGQAVARNRIALRVPCHRVVPVSGGPGQYRWGKARKEQLLRDEGAI